MQITNELKTRKIDLIKIESVKEHYPSYNLQILIGTENIQTNFNNFIWVSQTDIDNFLADLENLDKNRNDINSIWT